MNCSNCGKPLLAGSNICPVCGADNSGQAAPQVAQMQPPTPENNNQIDSSSIVNNQVIPPQNPVTESIQPNTLETQVSAPLSEVESEPPISLTQESSINAEAQASPETLPVQNVETIPQNMEVHDNVQETNEALMQESNNNTSGDTLNDDFVELEDEEKVNITENMAPPSLNVEEENLASGTGDLTNEESVSTYSEEAEQEQLAEEKEEQTRQEERVDIAIPSVQTTVEVAMPNDGSAPEMIQDTNTVGDSSAETPTTLESPGKKSRFKISIKTGSKNVPKALMIVVAIIFLVIGILLGKMFFSKNYCSTSTKRSVLSNTKVKYVSDGKNNTTNINGYTYKIPEQYTYDKDSGGLLVYSETDSFRIFIKSAKGVYSNLAGAKNSIRETLRDNSYTVSNVKELKSNEVEFLVFETTTKMNNRMLAFAKATDTEVFYIEIVTTTNTFDYDVLDVAADIIKNAQASEKNTNMENISVNDISEVSIKAAEEYSNLLNR